MRRPFTNLTLDERRVISRMLQAKVPKAKIAAMLGRDRSTITREVKRNWWHDKDVPQADGYRAPAEVFESNLIAIRNRLE